MSDPLMDHLEFRGGCLDDEVYGEFDDRLHLALSAAHSQLYVTTRDFIKPAPYQGEAGLEANDELS